MIGWFGLSVLGVAGFYYAKKGIHHRRKQKHMQGESIPTRPSQMFLFHSCQLKTIQVPQNPPDLPHCQTLVPPPMLSFVACNAFTKLFCLIWTNAWDRVRPKFRSCSSKQNDVMKNSNSQKVFLLLPQCLTLATEVVYQYILEELVLLLYTRPKLTGSTPQAMLLGGAGTVFILGAFYANIYRKHSKQQSTCMYHSNRLSNDS
jgi:hypothetical protein